MILYRRSENDPAPHGQADPYIIFADGRYYIYATHGRGVQLYSADSITGDWKYEGFCFMREGYDGYWAPAVINYNGKYYMYVSCKPVGTDPAKYEGLVVATSNTPYGPFKYECDLLAPFSIDAHVIEYGGSLYLFYSMDDWDAERPGTYIALDRLITPFKAEGKPVKAVWATLDQEIFCRDRYRPGQHWHTIEGAFYINEGDNHYLMYSGSAYGQPTYFVGYAYANGKYSDLRDIKWLKYPSPNVYHPLLCANDFVEGTGHNSAIKDPTGQWWIIYHGRDVNGSNAGEDRRTMRADRLHIDGEVMRVDIERPE